MGADAYLNRRVSDSLQSLLKKVPVQLFSHVIMICGKTTCLTPCDPEGYRNYNQELFRLTWFDSRLIQRLHHSVSIPRWPFPVFLQLWNQVTTTKNCLRGTEIPKATLQEIYQKKPVQECWLPHQLLKRKMQKVWRKQYFQLCKSWLSVCFLQEPCWVVTHTHAETHTLSHGCAASATTAPSSGKEAHSEGSYDSAFGVSARPPVLLWGAWGSSTSTTSLISTWQFASCCGWIQGMSGAMSRSHLKWQDENEGQGLAYGAD